MLLVAGAEVVTLLAEWTQAAAQVGEVIGILPANPLPLELLPLL
ncbi:uncharacterized protein METZ01_LOCUS340135 [marine metagenome]|uniref:Uncharacterized protein n=1 Tax=marine metagenome TaxID=408172 RepID=A0A382QSH6_9ZZZZ